MTILESMNANIPLLLRDLPGTKPILFDYYLKANSQQTFKDELTKLKEDADYYAKACEGSKARRTILFKRKYSRTVANNFMIKLQQKETCYHKRRNNGYRRN